MNRRITRHDAAAFFANTLVYGLNGIYAAIPIYLAAVGMTDVESGWLLAINPFVMCFAPVLWGRILDRAKTKNVFMAVLVLGAALAYLGILVSSEIFWIAAMLFLYSFFQSPFNAVIDTLTVHFTDTVKRPYGFFRVMGTIGYAILALTVTFFAPSSAFVMYAVVAVLGAAAVLFMMRTPGGDSGTPAGEKGTVRAFAASLTPELILLFAVTAVTQFVWGIYSDFYPTYLTGTVGLDNSMWGLLCFVTTMSEVPFFLLYTPLFRRVRAGTVLGVSLGAMALRFFLLVAVADMLPLFLVGFFTGLFVTVVNYCMTLYIMRAVEPRFLSLTQNLSYAVGWGIPRVLAGALGGYLCSALGFRYLMWAAAGLLLLTALSLLPLRRIVSRASDRIKLP